MTLVTHGTDLKDLNIRFSCSRNSFADNYSCSADTILAEKSSENRNSGYHTSNVPYLSIHHEPFEGE